MARHIRSKNALTYFHNLDREGTERRSTFRYEEVRTTMESRCDNCKYHVLFDTSRLARDGRGKERTIGGIVVQCHRYPPASTVAGQWGDLGGWDWPLVNDTDWCGEWRNEGS